MKPMILGNNDPMIMNSRKKKIITLRKWKKSVKVQKTKMRLNLVAKQTMIVEVDINEFSMGSIAR